METGSGATHPELAAELARIREAVGAAAAGAPGRWSPGARHEVNPTLQALPVRWRNLAAAALGARSEYPGPAPEPGEELLLVWKPHGCGHVSVRAASAEDLLALKCVVEERDPRDVAAAGPLPLAAVGGVIQRAVAAGILLAPRPLLRRAAGFPAGEIDDETFLTASGFTLQWHLTQACDLHCRHCYDRSARAAVPLGAALRVLADLEAFCGARRVSGAVSFSGGNPLLHAHFPAIYRAAAQHGFGLAILGNPAPRERIEELLAIAPPAFYQVSLEGLREHNDWVRGAGHFDRTLEFLATLKSLGVSTMVMLTLTADNIDQVLPLAERLRGLADDFHFNRLAPVGEGARLRLPTRERYERFLGEYLAAATTDRALGIKDNLINIVRRRRGEPPFGGCTGFGCGAAFNFLALLADGEAHACRKFPSPLGNAVRAGLAAVYDSPAAARYRLGCAACGGCAIRPVCGGCLAVAHGLGRDPLRERDPLCFLEGA